MRPTSTRILITIVLAILVILWNRQSLAAGDLGSTLVAALTGAILGYLAAPGLEFAWENRIRSGDRDRIVILAAGGMAAILGAVVYPWVTGQQVEHWTTTLLIVLAAGCAELFIRIRRRRQRPA